MNQTISVSGIGTAAAPPDLAILDIGVEVLGRSVAQARATATNAMEAVIASLRDSEIADTKMKTTSYTINPEYDHRQGSRLTGFRVTNIIEIEIEDMVRLGEIIDVAAAAGSDHVIVRSLRFAHRDPGVLETEARSRAWLDASAKARQLAMLAGVEVGGVVAISEQHNQRGPVPMRAMAMEAAAAVPIETGELAVTISIHVEFEID
jgi:uncharacterized protein